MTRRPMSGWWILPTLVVAVLFAVLMAVGVVAAKGDTSVRCNAAGGCVDDIPRAVAVSR